MIAIIDYESGNLRSIAKALEEVGAKVKVTDNPKTLARAKGIVLPGVGAFHHGMKVLKKRKLLSPILEALKEKKPFLGICLGLQLLFTESEEHGLHKGLEVIKGRVKKLPGGLKIPHLGWNQVKISKPKTAILTEVINNDYFYFIHSYYAEPIDKDIIAATTAYGPEFASVIVQDNIWAVQFHPEKSSQSGLKILKNFCQYAR